MGATGINRAFTTHLSSAEWNDYLLTPFKQAGGQQTKSDTYRVDGLSNSSASSILDPNGRLLISQERASTYSARYVTIKYSKLTLILGVSFFVLPARRILPISCNTPPTRRRSLTIPRRRPNIKRKRLSSKFGRW